MANLSTVLSIIEEPLPALQACLLGHFVNYSLPAKRYASSST
jgi:hypothetical protein